MDQVIFLETSKRINKCSILATIHSVRNVGVGVIKCVSHIRLIYLQLTRVYIQDVLAREPRQLSKRRGLEIHAGR